MDEIKEMLKQVIISEEPVNSLEECLKLGGTEQFEAIADEYGYENADEVDVEQLKGEILEKMAAELLYDTASGLNVMARLNGMPFDMKDEAFVFAILNYRTKGWVYVCGTEEQPLICVPDEIAEQMKQVREQADFNKKTARVKELFAYLEVCINLYKVFEQKQFLHIWNEHHEEKLDEEELCTFLLDAYERTHEFWCEGEYIIDCALEEQQDYLACLQKVSGKEYYCPKKSEIMIYADDNVDTDEPHYKELKNYLRRKMKNDNAIEEMLFEYVDGCLLDLDVSKVPELSKVYQLEFDTNADLQQFLGLLSEWYNNTRLWIERGFTAAEKDSFKFFNLNGEKADMFVIKNTKIGRNDPCPCGSGRKYKQCCGR